MKIQIEVIPTKCTGRNLHSEGILVHGKWEEISERIRSRRVCCGCGKIFSQCELRAHEVWEFDAENMVQRLKQIVPLCEKCHQVAHYHFLFSSPAFGDRDLFISKAHYMEINLCEQIDFERALDKSMSRFRELNQLPGEWSMDISYILKKGLAEYWEVCLEALEQAAPGSQKYLQPYAEPAAKLYFNSIPEECLVDRADEHYARMIPQACDICGREEKLLYKFYDFRVREVVPEMFLAGTRQICSLCRQTIFFGAHKYFMKNRKTTKHYMQVTGCSYEECLEHSKNARLFQKIYRAQKLYLYLKTPYLSSRNLFLARNQYLYKHGARFDGVRKKWYLRPVRGLGNFKTFL